METLCTRRDFERAKRSILDYLMREGYAPRRLLSNFRVWGIPYEAIELAVRHLRADGVIEELYTLPQELGKPGQRKEYYALTTALNAKQVRLPDGVVREQQAFDLIADLEEAETA